MGCTGRSTFEKCVDCKQHHDPQKKCDDKRHAKWLHSHGFKASESLYNYCNAKKYIRESQVVILVEGPSDIWKLEQAGIHNGVALFGLSLSPGQFNLLNSSGALSVIVVLDNDPNQAGQNATKKIHTQLSRLYRLYYPQLKKNDIGEMGIDEITQDILPYIEKIKQL